MDPPTTGAENAVLLYITFSGESGKPGVTEPINNVYGIRADGSYANTKDLLNTTDVTLNELRGMAFSTDGKQLFLANAHKSLNQILVFGPMGTSPASTPYVSEFASPATANATGLMHPYQPVLDGSGNVYVSSQDTFVVTGFSSSGGSEPAGTVRATPAFWSGEKYQNNNLYQGTWAPADETSQAAHPPKKIKSSNGGLKAPRGIVVSSALNRLYVADNTDNSVKSYDLTTGEYYGKVAEFSTGRPVGLALDATQGRLYVTVETSMDVHVIDVLTSSSGICDSSCSQNKIITTQEPNAVLNEPSGIVIFPTVSANTDTVELYVNSRLGLVINRYVYDFNAGALTASSTFATGFTDTPEQLIAAPL